jgi:choline-phosphate cytidylyltransferase
VNYKSYNVVAHFIDEEVKHDDFVKMDFVYPNAVASLKIGSGVKTEGELIISGTKGYIYVPAPWWNTDYFELRYEEASQNKRYFYQLDGEGIRYELVAFAKAIDTSKNATYIPLNISKEITKCMEAFIKRKNVISIT